jgi:hypothetical protein
MLFLKIEEKYYYMWTCHVENWWRFILVKRGFLKLKHRQGKRALEFGNSIFRLIITRIQYCCY